MARAAQSMLSGGRSMYPARDPDGLRRRAVLLEEVEDVSVPGHFDDISRGCETDFNVRGTLQVQLTHARTYTHSTDRFAHACRRAGGRWLSSQTFPQRRSDDRDETCQPQACGNVLDSRSRSSATASVGDRPSANRSRTSVTRTPPDGGTARCRCRAGGSPGNILRCRPE